MTDIFGAWVLEEWLDQCFAVMAATPHHVHQVLTKRPERALAYLTALGTPAGADRLERAARANGYSLRFHGVPLVPWPLPSVWLGVSVETQQYADERIPLLLQTPAAVRFISAEPLLGPVDLSAFLPVETIGGVELERWLDWCIIGGESGPGARPCHVEWVADIVKQCRAAGVSAFVKQLGAVPYVRAARLRHWEWRHLKSPENKRFTAAPDDALGWRVHIIDKKGGDITEFPPDLRVREFPRVGVPA